MTHKKDISVRYVKYKVVVFFNIVYLGRFTQNIPLIEHSTNTVQHTQSTKKSLKETIKKHLIALNIRFKVGNFRLFFDCKIEELPTRAPRTSPKIVDSDVAINKIMARAISEIQLEITDFLTSTKKDLIGIESEIEKSLYDENRSSVVIKNQLKFK